MSLGSSIYQLAFQISPIVLTQGIATNIPGQMLPIVSITEPAQFLTGLLSGSGNLGLDDFFAHFSPLPGATLIDNQVATYPFANQAVAGNAIIANPLTLSMLMVCPARGSLGYVSKLATMMALREVLNQHGALGGTYTVVTPSYFYTNGILTNMRDVSNTQSKQVQNAWQLDFFFPLLTLEAAQQAQNSLMSKLSGGTQIDGDPAWSGLSQATNSPASLAASSVVPAASNLPSANAAMAIA